MKKQYKIDKDCLRTITFNFNNPLEKSISKYLKTLKEEKGLNPKDCIISALLLYCEPEIIEAAGGSEREIEIAKRKTVLQLEARSKLLMFELGLEGDCDRQDGKKRLVSLVEEEEEEKEEGEEEEEEEKEKEKVKPREIQWGFPDD